MKAAASEAVFLFLDDEPFKFRFRGHYEKVADESRQRATLNIILVALPANGKLHVRAPKPKEGAEDSAEAAQSQVATEMVTA